MEQHKHDIEPAMVALCGKSGSGKTTLSRALVKALPDNFYEVISYTTRPRRHNEVDGVDYEFCTDAAFQIMRHAGCFIESAKHEGHWYGSQTCPKSYGSRVPVVVLNGDGIEQVRENTEKLHIFELWVDERELRKRLLARHHERVFELERRIGWEAKHHVMPPDAMRIMHYSTSYAIGQMLGAMGRTDLVEKVAADGQTMTMGDQGWPLAWLAAGVGQGRGAAE